MIIIINENRKININDIVNENRKINENDIVRLLRTIIMRLFA